MQILHRKLFALYIQVQPAYLSDVVDTVHNMD